MGAFLSRSMPLICSMPSRRTPRTATRAPSAYLWAVLTRSLRRSSVSGGSGTRITWPSVCGLRPRPESRIATSAALVTDLSQTCTDSRPGPATEMLATWFSGCTVP